MRYRSLATRVIAVAAVAGCAAPTNNPSSLSSETVDVRAGDHACVLSSGEARAGTLTFNVTNIGAQVTEFRLQSGDKRIVGEVENIGPSTTRGLVVQLADGKYTAVCKPGIADGAQTPFTVTGSAPRPVDTHGEVVDAVAQYKRYAVAQVAALVPKTQEFADAVKVNDVNRAKALFPLARTGWERIEPVAESVGDIDTKIDAREQDQRPPGGAWTGFHRLEKDLWVDGLQADSPAVADRLVADVRDLQARIAGVELRPAQLADGAKELFDEVAIIKLIGAEDIYSHTDLWDLNANIDGVRAVVAALRPVIDQKDPTLGPLFDAQFGDVQDVLDGERLGDGFRSFKDLSQYDIVKMSITVNALSRSASRLADAVTS